MEPPPDGRLANKDPEMEMGVDVCHVQEKVSCNLPATSDQYEIVVQELRTCDRRYFLGGAWSCPFPFLKTIRSFHEIKIQKSSEKIE